MRTTITKCFSEGLDEIIMSGSEVGIFYFCTLFENDAEGNSVALVERRAYKYIIYRPADNVYDVSINMDSSNAFNDMEGAKTMISTLDIGLISMDAIDRTHSYSVAMEAALNTIEIEAIDAKQFDLNAFWNYKYPERRSDWIKGEEFFSR